MTETAGTTPERCEVVVMYAPELSPDPEQCGNVRPCEWHDREPTKSPDLWFIDRADLDLGNADPGSLKVGGFYDRHPQFGGQHGFVAREAQVLAEVEQLTRGAHLLGAVPNFDADVLGQRMRAHGILPSWHYHLIDIEALAVGWIAGLRAAGGGENGRDADLPSLPWRSDELSLACGVEPPSEQDRHTALADAAWALRLYEAIADGSKP